MSNGTPMKPTSILSATVAIGKRIMVAIPPARGMSLPPSGWLNAESFMIFPCDFVQLSLFWTMLVKLLVVVKTIAWCAAVDLETKKRAA